MELESLKERGERDSEINIEEIIDKQFKFDDNYKPVDPRISTTPKNMKHKENYDKVHCKHPAQNQ